MDLVDLAESLAKEARDNALEHIAENAGSFSGRALAAIKLLPPGEYTGEDIRKALLGYAIGPHHPNAWGSVIMTAVRRGALAPTGEWRSMKAKKSHARKTPVYRIGTLCQCAWT